MIFTKDAYVGGVEWDDFQTHDKSAIFYVDRLANLNMKDWIQVPFMRQRSILSITLKIVTTEFNTIYVHKDLKNNMIIDGYEFMIENIKSIGVEYLLPATFQNNFDVQDIIASELIVHRYKVSKIDAKNAVHLQAVIE